MLFSRVNGVLFKSFIYILELSGVAYHAFIV